MTSARPDPRPPSEAWEALVAGLGEAGERVAALTAGRSTEDQADGYRALLRALHNQLARFEVDRDRPELVPFNGWRQRFFMDNPDFAYWVADLTGERSYRVRGNRGDAVYVSVTVYVATGTADASAASRLDSDAMAFSADGAFDVQVGGAAPASGDWLPLPEGPCVLWVRFFHEDVRNDRPASCAIEPIETVPAPPFVEPDRFSHHLARLGRTMTGVAMVFDAVDSQERHRPNELRHWTEMQGGAAFTEPGIHYVRGAWQLEPGQALVVEGEVVECRHWCALLYSPFLNSLDHRHRQVSVTGSRVHTVDGRFRLVLSAADPGIATWLDTEGRPFGLVVLRWLQPMREPALPDLRVVALDDLTGPGPVA